MHGRWHPVLRVAFDLCEEIFGQLLSGLIRDPHESHSRRGEPFRDLVLAVSRLQERLDECGLGGRGQTRHPLPEHPGDLLDRLLAQSGLEEQVDRLRGLDLFLAEHPILGRGLGQPEQSSAPEHLRRL